MFCKLGPRPCILTVHIFATITSFEIHGATLWIQKPNVSCCTKWTFECCYACQKGPHRPNIKCCTAVWHFGAYGASFLWDPVQPNTGRCLSEHVGPLLAEHVEHASIHLQMVNDDWWYMQVLRTKPAKRPNHSLRAEMHLVMTTSQWKIQQQQKITTWHHHQPVVARTRHLPQLQTMTLCTCETEFHRLNDWSIVIPAVS